MNSKLLGGLILRVISAGMELDAFDEGRSQRLSVYEDLSYEANSRGLDFRQHLALAIYLSGNEAMKRSRAFDNCFENNDGDQVVAFLVQQARANRQLERQIANDFGGNFPEQWLETAKRVEAA